MSTIRWILVVVMIAIHAHEMLGEVVVREGTGLLLTRKSSEISRFA